MKIVFVCSGNTCRSPMAEALMRSALAARRVRGVEVLSAGVGARDGEPASLGAMAAMRAMGLDLGGHRARALTPALADGAVMLCMTSAHVRAARRVAPAGEAYLLSEYAGVYGEVPDPYGMPCEAYRRTAELLREWTDLIATALAEEMGGGR